MYHIITWGCNQADTVNSRKILGSENSTRLDSRHMCPGDAWRDQRESQSAGDVDMISFQSGVLRFWTQE